MYTTNRAQQHHDCPRICAISHDAIDDLEATRVGAIIQAKRQARKTDSHHPDHWTVGM